MSKQTLEKENEEAGKKKCKQGKRIERGNKQFYSDTCITMKKAT